MGIEFEVRVEGHSQYTGSPFQEQYGVVQSDLKMGARQDQLSRSMCGVGDEVD